MSVLLILALGAPVAAEPLSVAVGASAAWQRRRDFGAQSRSSLAPELIGFVYLPVADRLYLRPGARLGYVGLVQAEMPQALRIEERDLVLGLECGLVLDGPVLPSLTLGADLDVRFVDLDVEAPLGAPDESITGTDAHLGLHAQVGLGFPLARGRVVLEPFARWEHLFGDDRIQWRLGAEITVLIH